MRITCPMRDCVAYRDGNCSLDDSPYHPEIEMYLNGGGWKCHDYCSHEKYAETRKKGVIPMVGSTPW